MKSQVYAIRGYENGNDNCFRNLQGNPNIYFETLNKNCFKPDMLMFRSFTQQRR